MQSEEKAAEFLQKIVQVSDRGQLSSGHGTLLQSP